MRTPGKKRQRRAMEGRGTAGERTRGKAGTAGKRMSGRTWWEGKTGTTE
jgi:hypothetical protein